MSVTLDAITLPNDTQWQDEFANVPVGQLVSFSVTGAQIIQTSAQQAGRPITLVCTLDTGWPRYALVESVRVKAATPPTSPMTLTLLDGRTFTVMFDYANKAIEAAPVYFLQNDGSEAVQTDPYTLTIRLITT